MIPNPIVRYAAVTAATALIPILISKVADRREARRAGRRRRKSAG